MYSTVPGADRRPDARRSTRELDTIYADFTRQVGEARKLDAAKIDAAARGRVFSGVDAKRAGLVDELGGLQLALSIAKAKAGIDEVRPIEIVRFPAEHRPLAASARPRHASSPASTRRGPTIRAPREVREALARFGIVPAPAMSACRPAAALALRRRSSAQPDRRRRCRAGRRRGAAAPVPRPGRGSADAGARRCGPPARPRPRWPNRPERDVRLERLVARPGFSRRTAR